MPASSARVWVRGEAAREYSIDLMKNRDHPGAIETFMNILGYWTIAVLGAMRRPVRTPGGRRHPPRVESALQRSHPQASPWSIVSRSTAITRLVVLLMGGVFLALEIMRLVD